MSDVTVEEVAKPSFVVQVETQYNLAKEGVKKGFPITWANIKVTVRTIFDTAKQLVGMGILTVSMGMLFVVRMITKLVRWIMAQLAKLGAAKRAERKAAKKGKATEPAVAVEVPVEAPVSTEAA
jgi:hypothetical protein